MIYFGLWFAFYTVLVPLDVLLVWFWFVASLRSVQVLVVLITFVVWSGRSVDSISGYFLQLFVTVCCCWLLPRLLFLRAFAVSATFCSTLFLHLSLPFSFGFGSPFLRCHCSITVRVDLITDFAFCGS